MCDVSEFIRSRYMIGSTFKVELYVPTDSCTAAGQLIIHDAMLTEVIWKMTYLGLHTQSGSCNIR